MSAHDRSGTTLVVQSHRDDRPAWIDRCLSSVEGWAGTCGYAYERLGDEFLDLAPRWIAERAEGVLPVTDVARLALIRDRISQGWARVVWLDADVLVFDPNRIRLPDRGLAVGWEVWITGRAEGALRALDLINNTVLVASRHDRAAVENLLAETLEEARNSQLPIHPRRLGPDLLTKLDRHHPLPVVDSVTLLSPPVVRDISAGGGPALDRFRHELHRRSPSRVGAANLCASMASTAWPDVDDPEAIFDQAIDALLQGQASPLERGV